MIYVKHLQHKIYVKYLQHTIYVKHLQHTIYACCRCLLQVLYIYHTCVVECMLQHTFNNTLHKQNTPLTSAICITLNARAPKQDIPREQAWYMHHVVS